jgi:outer membrane protein TolC
MQQYDTGKNQAVIQKDLINLSREKLAYAENRFAAGTGISLEVREAQQGLKVAQNELDRIVATQKRALANLKGFLGLKPTQEITPDIHDTRRQVLGSFDPTSVTWEQAKSRSYDLKQSEIITQLQAYNVKLAVVRSFPTILFTTQTPDPLNSNNKYGLYAGVGLYIPVWDGFKRIRNVSRQKTILKQYGADNDLQERDLENKFNEAKDKVKETAYALQLAQSQTELVRLRARQKEIIYQSGGVILPVFLDSRREVLEAQKQLAQKALENDNTILALRQISGDLGYTYVDASSWQK